MKQKNRWLFWIAGGALVYYFIRQTKRFDVGTASVSSLRIAGGGVQINARLPIINRSNLSVPIQGFLGALLYNGQQIGTTTLKAPVTIAARSVGTPEFLATVSIASVLTNTPLLSLLNSLSQKYLGFSIPGLPSDAPLDPNALQKYLGGLRLRGTLYVGGVSVDIDQALTA